MVALGLATSVAGVAPSASGVDVPPASEPVPAIAPEPDSDPKTAWLFGPEGRVEVEALSVAIGSSGAVLGVDIDHEARSLTVVVDLGHVDGARVEAVVAAYDGPLDVDVRVSEQTADRLEDALRHVEQRPGDAVLHSEPSASYVDPVTETVVVITPADGAVAQAMREEYGDDVTIVDGRPHRLGGGRTADLSPHWGGAQIWNQQTGNPCSSGFTTYNLFGVRGSTTAAHCGAANAPWWTAWTTNPSYFLGYGWGNTSFPTQDFQWIHASGPTYTNVIYTDPGSPSSRNVTGKADPVLSSTVCASGAATRASCSPVVTSTNASLCDDWGCTPNLAYAVANPWSAIATSGDSGGPVYTRSGSTNAIARGLIVGTAFGNDVFIQKRSTIESAGLTILTSP